MLIALFRNANADRVTLAMEQAPRHLARPRKNERIWTGDALAHDAELPVVDVREAPRVGHSSTDEREQMPLAEAPDRAHATGGFDVAEPATQRIARVGRIRDDAAVGQDLSRLPYEARLGVCGMNGEVLRHESVIFLLDI